MVVIVEEAGRAGHARAAVEPARRPTGPRKAPARIGFVAGASDFSFDQKTSAPGSYLRRPRRDNRTDTRGAAGVSDASLSRTLVALPAFGDCACAYRGP
jgi:hypothetical protein